MIKLLSQSKYKAHKSAENSFIDDNTRRQEEEEEKKKKRRKEEEDAGEAGWKRYGCTASSSVYTVVIFVVVLSQASRWTFRSSDAICIDL